MVTTHAVHVAAQRMRTRRPRKPTTYAGAKLRRQLGLSTVLSVVLMALFASPANADPDQNGVCAIPGVDNIPGLCGSGVIGKIAGGAFKDIADSILQGYQVMLTWAMAWWIKLPTPSLDSANSTLMSDINDHMVPLQILGVSVSVLFFAARMAWTRSQGLVDDVEDGFKVIIRASMATSVIPIALTVGGQVSDRLSNWLVSEAIGGLGSGSNDGQIIKNFLHLSALTGGQVGTGAILLLGIVGFLGACLQLAFLVIRQAMLLLVVAGLPVAAAFSGTGPGSQTYSKLISWSIAFLLFKPVGALTYFIAFKAAGAQGERSEQQVLLGMVLMALCAFVLPAMMRLMGGGVTGSMGGGASGAAAVGAIAGAAMAAGTLAAGGAGAGAGAGAAGASSLSGRGQSGGDSGGDSGSGGQSGSPAIGSQQKPGPQQGTSTLGDTGGDGESGGSNKGGAKEAATAGAATGAGTYGAATAGANSEADGGDEVQVQPPPRLQSGHGEHSVSR